jgi:hypothetical protein
MMLSGLELAVAKSAGSAAIKSLGPAHQYLRRRERRQRLINEIAGRPSSAAVTSFMNSLSPQLAAQLTRFVESPDFGNLALGLATLRLLHHCGKKTDTTVRNIRTQISQLIALKSSLPPEQVGVATDLIFAVLSSAVEQNTTLLLEESNTLPVPSQASLFKIQAGFLSSLVRNSELLSRISDLAVYEEFENQLCLQIRNVYGTMRLPHAGTSRQVPYNSLYVQPTLDYVDDENTRSRSGRYPPLTVQELMEGSLRSIILGDPGGGKSTLSLKLAYDTAGGRGRAETTVPFLIVLREYAAEFSSQPISLLDYIHSICKVPLGLTPPPGAIEYLLLNGHALVIFDGLDELLDTSLRRKVVETVSGFTYRYPLTPILVTSRRIGYADAPLDPELFATANLREFNNQQVVRYVSNWFNLDDSVPPSRKGQLAKSFIDESSLVEDLRVNPLMLSLMCGIYSSENYIPRNRPDVYEKCALLLFERWDKQRGVNASLSFDAHVQAAMRSLALWMYPQQESQQGLSRDKMVAYMKRYLLEKRFDNEEEAENAASGFIDFCKGRAWVITDVGADQYGFTHRTFLEYFAASQLVRLHPNPQDLCRVLEDNILKGGWDVVAQLALQIVNKSVEDGADNFLELLIERTSILMDPGERSRLLSFAAQALTYIVPRPPVLRSITEQVVSFYYSLFPDKRIAAAIYRTPIYLLLGASAENLPLVSRYLRETLEQRLGEYPGDQATLSLALQPTYYAEASYSPGAAYRISSGNVDFWQAWNESSRAAIGRAIDVQRREHQWVALYLLEHGDMTLDEILHEFGPACFFEEIDPAGGLPFATRIALTLTSSLERLRRRRNGSINTTSMSLDEIDALRRSLIEIPLPWFHRPAPLAHGITDMLLERMRHAETGELSSLSFFAVCQVELRDEVSPYPSRVSEKSGHGDPRVDAISTLEELLRAKGRTRGPGRPEVITLEPIARLLEDIGVEPKTAEFVEKWGSDRATSLSFLRAK